MVMELSIIVLLLLLLSGWFNCFTSLLRVNRSFAPFLGVVTATYIIFICALCSAANLGVWLVLLGGMAGLVLPIWRERKRARGSVCSLLGLVLPPQNIFFLAAVTFWGCWLLPLNGLSGSPDFYTLWWRQLLFMRDFGAWHNGSFDSHAAEYCCLYNAISYYFSYFTGNFSAILYIFSSKVPIIAALMCLLPTIRWQRICWLPAILFAVICALFFLAARPVESTLVWSIALLLLGVLLLGFSKKLDEQRVIASVLPPVVMVSGLKVIFAATGGWMSQATDAAIIASASALVMICCYYFLCRRETMWKCMWIVPYVAAGFLLIKASTLTFLAIFGLGAGVMIVYRTLETRFRGGSWRLAGRYLFRAATVLAAVYFAAGIGYGSWKVYSRSVDIRQGYSGRFNMEKFELLLTQGFSVADCAALKKSANDFLSERVIQRCHGIQYWQFYGEQTREAKGKDLMILTGVIAVLLLFGSRWRRWRWHVPIVLTALACTAAYFMMYFVFNELLLGISGLRFRHAAVGLLVTLLVITGIAVIELSARGSWRKIFLWTIFLLLLLSFGLSEQLVATQVRNNVTHRPAQLWVEGNHEALSRLKQEGRQIYCARAWFANLFVDPDRYVVECFTSQFSVPKDSATLLYLRTGGDNSMAELKKRSADPEKTEVLLSDPNLYVGLFRLHFNAQGKIDEIEVLADNTTLPQHILIIDPDHE